METRTPLPTDRADLARALFEQSGDALLLFDPQTDHVLDANPAAQQLSGFARGELLALSAADLFRHAADGATRQRHALRHADGYPHGLDGFLLRTRVGGWVPVSLTVTRLAAHPRPLGLVTARTDRWQADEALWAGREQLAQVLEAVADGVLFVDHASVIRLANGAAERILGSPRADLLGRTWADFAAEWTHMGGGPVAREERSDVRVLGHGEDVFGLTRQRVRPDGSRTVLRGNSIPLRDARGRVAGMVATFRDVTEQLAAAEALAGSEERFRTLVEKSSDVVTLVDAAGVIRYTTPSAERVTGRPPGEVIGRSAFDLAHPDEVDRLRGQLAQSLAEPDRDHAFQCRYLHADGSWRHVEGVVRNRLADPVIRAVVVNFRDVTDRHRAEEALAGQHALLRSILNSIPDLIARKDAAGAYRGCNAAFAAFLGLAQEAVVGRSDGDLFPPEPAVALAAADARVLAGGPAERLELRLTAADGRPALLETLRVPLAGSDGRPAGLLGISRDITQRRQLEEQLRQAGKLEAVGQLAGGVAHDFNNLLTAVLGNLSLVQKMLPADHPARDLLAASDKAAWRAAELTRQLLGFARRATVRLEPVDVNAAVAETVALLRRAIDPRIVLDGRPAPDLDTVLADLGQIGQVLMNLCLNARDAMPDGGTLTLETANAAVTVDHARRHVDARPGAFVRLTVTDTGAGIPPAARARVFEPFFTTKGIGRGTGLGLAMVHGIVRQHDGWVEVESEVGRGTRFDVYLPRSGRPAVAPLPPAPPPDGGTETVLLADDEPMLRTLGKAILEAQGYRVLVAADGQEAVEAYRREAGRIDLVILDLSMPRLSGRDACRQLVALDPAVRVLLSSGYAADQAASVQEAGVRGFVGKPYRPAGLAAAVRAALDAKG
jgi:PAS domain S-box-containing protein